VIFSKALIINGAMIISSSNPLIVPKTGNLFWISDSKILLAKESEKHIFIEGEKNGTAYIQATNKKGIINKKAVVTSDGNFKALRKCKTQNFKFQSNKIYIYNPTINNIKKTFSCGFEKLNIKNQNQKKLTNYFQKAESLLQLKGIKIIKAKWNNNDEQREVTLTTKSDIHKAQLILKNLVPFYIFKTSENKSNSGKTLIYNLNLFEFSRTKARKLGVRWPSEIIIQPLDINLKWQPITSNPQVELGLDFGESLGVAKILAKPTIRSKPGVQAEFISGGEIPIRNKSFGSDSTSWKSYGLIIKLKTLEPVDVGDEQVTIDFSVEVSEPDMATAINGIPGLRKRKLSSQFDLPVNKTTVLTSMLKINQGNTNSSFPGVSGVPVLNSLLGSNSSSETKNELWFSITPSWITGDNSEFKN